MNMSTGKSSKVADPPEPEAEALAAEIAALREDFQALVAQVAAVGAAVRDEATSTVRAKAAIGLEAGETVVADLVGEWREIDRRVIDATRERPWRALGAAGLAGLALGLILRR